MHVDVHYVDADRKVNDRKALEDINNYLGVTKVAALCSWVKENRGRARLIDQLSLMFEVAGMRGYPFHAFCRAYCLSEYRTWMAAPGEDEVAYETDEEGFIVEEEK